MNDDRKNSPPPCDPLVAQLRQQRIARGLTAKDIAAAVGVSRVTVTMWETSRVDIPLSRLQAYARRVGFELRLLLIPPD